MRKLSMKKPGTPASGAEKSSGSGGVSAEGDGAGCPARLAWRLPGFGLALARRCLPPARLRGEPDGGGAGGEVTPRRGCALRRSGTTGVASTSVVLWVEGSVAGAALVWVASAAGAFVEVAGAGAVCVVDVLAPAPRLGSGAARATVTAPASSATRVDRWAVILRAQFPSR